MPSIKYLYPGVLSEQTLRTVSSFLRVYPCAVELTRLPSAEILGKLPEKKWAAKQFGALDPMSHRFYGFAYKTAASEDDGVFMFFTSEAEKAIVATACPDLVVDMNPFTTEFQINPSHDLGAGSVVISLQPGSRKGR